MEVRFYIQRSLIGAGTIFPITRTLCRPPSFRLWTFRIPVRRFGSQCSAATILPLAKTRPSSKSLNLLNKFVPSIHYGARTIFIQTEKTPNNDVMSRSKECLHCLSNAVSRPSNSCPTIRCCPRASQHLFWNTSLLGRHLPLPILRPWQRAF